MNLIWKKYKKTTDLLKTKYLEVFLAENKKGNKVLIQKLISNKIVEEIKKEKIIKIIDIIKNKTETYIIIEYDPKILTHPLIGPIYPPFTKEENKLLSSKLKYAYCLILNDQYKETEYIGYFIKFKIKNFPIKKGLFLNFFIDVEKVKVINFKYENKSHVINLSSKRKRYFSSKYEYFLIEVVNNDNIKDFIVYDETIDCNNKNKINYLSREVIRISFGNKIYSKNEIVDIEKKETTLFDFGKNNDIIKLNLNKSDTDNSFIILLNLKEKDYPIIGNNLFKYNIIENVKKQVKFSLLSHPSTISIKNIKFIEEKKNIANYQILNNGNISLLIHEYNIIYLNIYNQNLQLENKITFNTNTEYAKHKSLDNGNILLLFTNSFIIKLSKDNQNKYDIIQAFPEDEILKKDACQYKDYLIFVLKIKYIEIWKYNTSELKYIFHQKLTISKYSSSLRYDIQLICQKEFVISSTFWGTIFLDIDKNNKISIVSRVRNEFYFCPFIYNKKYLLTKNGDYIFDLRKKCPIAYCYLQFNQNCSIENIILLSNGNLLLEYENHENEKKYLIEAIIFENEIFVIQKIQLKYNFQLITQLKRGSIVIIKK